MKLLYVRLAMLAFAVLMARPLSAQCPDGSPPPCTRVVAHAPPAGSVLVLYLENLSHDTSDASIADGLTEEIIARLSQVPGLRVASRYASQSYRRRRIADPRQVGQSLGVRYVLDGSMRRTGAALRVVLGLTDANAGFNVWGATYERPVSAIFSVEDSVTVQVAEAILGQLSAVSRARLTPQPAASNTDAYQAFLRGRVAIRTRTAKSASTSVTQFRHAIALDRRFARAWAGLALTLALARDWGWEIEGVAPDSVQPLAVQAAREALALDSLNAESWLAMAMARRPEDILQALEFHRRAVALDSTSVEAVHQLAWGFLANGELDSAMLFERRAIARDPYYAFAYAGLGRMLNASGHADEALTVLNQGLAVDSTIAPLYWEEADALLSLGRPDQALTAVSQAAAFGFDSLGTQILWMLVRFQAGDTALVRRGIPDLEHADRSNPTRSRGGLAYSSASLLSGLHAQLGDATGAVRWAQQVAVWPRHYYVFVYRHHWLWASVRGDPQFQAFLTSLER